VGEKDASEHPADRRGRVDPPARAPAGRVATALCAATGADGRRTDETTHRLVESLLREYHDTVGDGGGVDFDPETGEFWSERGELRLEVDRFPLDGDRWEALVAGAAVVGLLAVAVGRAGTADAAWLPVAALGFVAAGAVVRRAARADVSITDAGG
jgi:hypothetical protein